MEALLVLCVGLVFLWAFEAMAERSRQAASKREQQP